MAHSKKLRQQTLYTLQLDAVIFWLGRIENIWNIKSLSGQLGRGA